MQKTGVGNSVLWYTVRIPAFYLSETRSLRTPLARCFLERPSSFESPDHVEWHGLDWLRDSTAEIPGFFGFLF